MLKVTRGLRVRLPAMIALFKTLHWRSPMGALRTWWLSDLPYLKASVTVGLFCDKGVPALVRLCWWTSVAAGVLWPTGWSPLEYFEDLMPSLVGLERWERRRSMGTQR
jgi:hypothetical protein